MSKEACQRYLTFARSPAALWSGNFRDFGASVRRMATLCEGGRIGVADVDGEIERLLALWRQPAGSDGEGFPLLVGLLGQARLAAIDRFDQVQLEEVVRTCRAARSLSDAGRSLFAASRAARSTTNDTDRLRKYLARFGLTLQMIQGIAGAADRSRAG
jgi:transcriptional regulatory protein RtcR